MTTVTNFTIPYHQFLDADGQATQSLPPVAHDKETLLKLYRLMTLLRVFDTKAIALQRTGKMGTYASTLGQEAISVVIGHVLKIDDVLCPYYRDHGALIQRGVKMSDIISYWGGDERGNHFTHPEDFPYCVPIAGQCLHAVGIATTFKIRKQKRVVVTTLGDGATSKGDFYEAVNLAGVWNLPVIFVINNNQWAISVARDQQSGAETLAQKGIAGGIASIQVDGNDVIALQTVIADAIEKARCGEGASVIEAMTFRLCDHTTADDAKRYVAPEQLADAWKKEPLLRLRAYLTKQGYWSLADEEQLKTDCAKEVEQAVSEYLAKPLQPVESIFDYLYAELPAALKEQREELLGRSIL